MGSLARSARGNRVLVVALAAMVVVAGVLVFGFLRNDPVPGFRAQACGIPPTWLERTKLGFFEERSGQISILPKYPAYMASGAGGWSHSGPWPYLQDVPLVFYGPGLVPSGVEVDRPVSLADIAPTLMTLMHGFYRSEGTSLDEVAKLSGGLLEQPAPKLIVTVVWDGGGWNTLEQWPKAWPNLRRLIDDGVSFTNATAGSSPSVTPAVHTTLGTGFFPATHGITGVPMRDEEGEVVDAFLNGDSSRFIQVPTLAERWDRQQDNHALVAMVGYEPWHLGMIGKGAETPGGDKDDAVWLDIDTNEWITNPDHYRLPDPIAETAGLKRDIDRLDKMDGNVDRSWRDNEILDDVTRLEETPAFIKYHARAMMNLIRDERYGEDNITDLMFTNFKQIDRVGHYFNMASPEVRDSLVESDKQLGRLRGFLDREVGGDGYVLVVTADHGQQPDAEAINSYGISPRALEVDIDEEFGSITGAVWPTEVFLEEDEMEERGVTVEDVSRFLANYRISDNISKDDAPTGRFDPDTRAFDMALPARMLPDIACGEPSPSP